MTLYLTHLSLKFCMAARLNISSGNSSALAFTVDTSLFFSSNATYRLSVRMSRDTRTTVSFLDVEVRQSAAGAPLDVGIACMPTASCLPPVGGALLVNLDGDRFIGVGSCAQGCNEFANVSYSWEVFVYRPGGVKEDVNASNTNFIPCKYVVRHFEPILFRSEVAARSSHFFLLVVLLFLKLASSLHCNLTHSLHLL